MESHVNELKIIATALNISQLLQVFHLQIFIYFSNSTIKCLVDFLWEIITLS